MRRGRSLRSTVEAEALVGLARALGRGEPEQGTILAAAADRLRREVGGGPGRARLGLEEPLDQARRTMAAADFERAAASGRALTTDEAVALALELANNAMQA